MKTLKYLIVYSLFILLLVGCGGGGGSSEPVELNDPPAGFKTQNIQLDTPSGVDVSDVVNVYDEVPVVANSLKLNVPDDGRILSFALNANGDPIFAGWLGSDDLVLSARTTLEVMVFFAMNGAMIPYEAQETLQTLLKESPQLDALARSIDSRLQSDPAYFSSAKQQMQDDLNALVLALLSVPEVAVASKYAPPKMRGLLVRPSNSIKGLSIDTVSGFNDIKIVNRYRRSALAFIDRVSTFNDGIETASPQKITELKVDSITGLDGGIGTISQIVTGMYEPGGLFESQNIAGVPKSTEIINLPNAEGADKTRYRIAIVGAGASEGDRADLTADEENKRVDLTIEFIVTDFLLPFYAQIMVPASSKEIEDQFDSGFAPSLVQDLIGLLKSSPPLYQKVKDSDIKGALEDTYNIIISAGTTRDLILELVASALIDNATNAASDKAIDIAEKFIGVSGAVDSALASIDMTAVFFAIAASDKANIWFIDSIDGKVSFTPPENKLTVYESVTLTADVVDAGNDAVFEYRFSTAGNFGEIFSGSESGTSIISSSPFVAYSAERPGTETINVAVFRIANTERIAVGEASATVKISGEHKLYPANATIDEETSITLQLVKDDLSTDLLGDDSLTYKIVWNTSGAHGSFAGGKNTVTRYDNNTVSYRSDNDVADDATDTFNIRTYVRSRDGGVRWILDETIEGQININNDPKKKTYITPILVRHAPRPENTPEGFESVWTHSYSYASVPIDPDAESYLVEFVKHYWGFLGIDIIDSPVRWTPEDYGDLLKDDPSAYSPRRAEAFYFDFPDVESVTKGRYDTISGYAQVTVYLK